MQAFTQTFMPAFRSPFRPVRVLTPLVVFLLVALAGSADVATALVLADSQDEAAEHELAEQTLLAALDEATTNTERAEVYWRLARARLEIGGAAKRDGAADDELLAIYDSGEAYADQAIAADPEQPLGYYWKSANMGRWGQVRGVLNSLFKAGGMRDLLEQTLALDPDHGGSYFVLGQLFTAVPGFPVSFGNVDFGVSLGRRALAQRIVDAASGREEMNYDYYVALAEALHKRDWDSGKRAREQQKKQRRYQGATGAYERGLYHEAGIELTLESDRQEAVRLLEQVVAQLQAKQNRDGNDDDHLAEARAYLQEWR